MLLERAHRLSHGPRRAPCFHEVPRTGPQDESDPVVAECALLERMYHSRRQYTGSTPLGMSPGLSVPGCRRAAAPASAVRSVPAPPFFITRCGLSVSFVVTLLVPSFGGSRGRGCPGVIRSVKINLGRDV